MKYFSIYLIAITAITVVFCPAAKAESSDDGDVVIVDANDMGNINALASDDIRFNAINAMYNLQTSTAIYLRVHTRNQRNSGSA